MIAQVYQRVIDFDRASKLRMLERVRIPVTTGTRTSEQALKAVLRVLDSHARDAATCRLKLATIAAEAGWGARSTAVRAIAELRRLHLVDVVQQSGGGKHASEYRIIWSNLRDLVDGDAAPVQAPDRWCTEPGPMAHGAPTDGAPCADRWRMVRLPMAHRAPSNEAQQETPPPPPPPSESSWAEAEAEVRKLLTDWETPLVAARSRVTPDHVLRVLLHYRAADGLLGLGALHRRLCRCHPDVPPDAGWPTIRPPSAGCRRALDRLAEVRRHLDATGKTLDEGEFVERFGRDLERRGLGQFCREALFRESMEAGSYA